MRTDRARWSDLILLISILFGAVVRFAPTMIAGAAINDGGMFYVLIEDLKANHFLLPAFTSYNQLNIPFAYPPLSVYVGTALACIGVPVSQIVRWVPPLIATVSIPAFYWMASLLLDSTSRGALAAMAYALMPRAFSWYVMGGGISRTFGVLFLLLTCGSAWALFSQDKSKYIVLTAAFGAGAVLSHPETGLHTAGACALILLFIGRNRRGLRAAALVSLGVLVLTSPWWASVLALHGFQPFWSALSTGAHSWHFWTPWLTFDFAQERFVTLLTVLGLIGFALQAIRRTWFLPTWLLAAFVFEPRSATAIAALPLAILAGSGLSDFVLPNIAAFASKTNIEVRDWTICASNSAVVRMVLGYIILSAFLGAFAFDLILANYRVPESSLAAMRWVRENAAPGGRFIVLTGRTDPFSDSTAEWFPALARRTSENTIQGREWLLGPNFMPFLNELEALQECMNQGSTCVAEWARTNNVVYDYIYIEKPDESNGVQPSRLLYYQLERDQNYRAIFENQGVAIFRAK